jgi:hypothetical protein
MGWRSARSAVAPPRARSHCRVVLLLIHFIPASLRDSAALFLQRHATERQPTLVEAQHRRVVGREVDDGAQPRLQPVAALLEELAPRDLVAYIKVILTPPCTVSIENP